tara:strand:- start:1045 stop:1899 length:855 start_codon:yes stop_codon:yes gene_type:complete
MGNEIEMINDDLNNFLTAFDEGNEKALMELSGQADGDSKPKMGLPRLTINYEQETDDGISLPRGAWRIWNGSGVVYADDVQIRPLLRTFEWSVWDQEEGRFSCKSVQKNKLGGEFPDTLGGNKCGRLSKQEEEALTPDDPQVLLSRSVNCNQVIYGVMDAPNAKNAQGVAAPIEAMPFIAYFKRSGFRPVSDFIQKQLTDRKIMMQKAVINFTTEKQKNGGVVYWTPKLSLVKEVSITDSDKELMKKFGETVVAHNESVFEDYKQAQKAMSNPADIDLEQRLAG